jgi:hypothetical protein
MFLLWVEADSATIGSTTRVAAAAAYCIKQIKQSQPIVTQLVLGTAALQTEVRLHNLLHLLVALPPAVVDPVLALSGMVVVQEEHLAYPRALVPLLAIEEAQEP